MNYLNALRLPGRTLRSISFAGIILAVGFLCANIGSAQSSADTLTTNPEEDRPHLKHQTERPSTYGVADDGSDVVAVSTKPSGPEVAPGLYLPAKGLVWVLDEFQKEPQLVRMKYVEVEVNNHTGSNLLKGSAVPFVFKQKKTTELKGATAKVRLHTTQPAIYFHGISRAMTRLRRTQILPPIWNFHWLSFALKTTSDL